jgi:CheY-like chemotaxis protein
MSDTILVLDDELDDLENWLSELRYSGYGIVATASTADAVRRFSAMHPDLILLDRMVPKGEAYAPETPIADTATLDTLELVLADIRRRPHLRLAPILIFTNYFDPEMAQRLQARDSRIFMLPKSTLPSELTAYVARIIDANRYDKARPELFDDQHPNTVPYYALDSQGKPLALQFVRLLPDAPLEIDGWTFETGFRDYHASETQRNHLLQLVARDRPQTVYGLYYTGGESDRWNAFVLFETAPAYRFGASGRAAIGIGRVMVARFLRECLYRDGRKAEYVLDGDAFGETPLGLGISGRSRPFFEKLGLREDPRRPLHYTVADEKARQILRTIHRL